MVDGGCFLQGFRAFFFQGGRKQKAVSLVFVAHPWVFLGEIFDFLKNSVRVACEMR